MQICRFNQKNISNLLMQNILFTDCVKYFFDDQQLYFSDYK